MNVRRGFVWLAVMTVCVSGTRSRADTPASSGEAIIEVNKNHIEFRHGKALFTRYVVADKVAKPYFWPIHVMPGKTVTRAWPMADDPEVKKGDHPHQKSLWFCHGDVIPEGIDFKKHFRQVAGIDFWAESRGHGKIVCVKVEKPTLAKTHAAIVTKNEWRTAEGQKILDETRTIHYHPFGAGKTLLILDIDLHATVCPITFADTKEGSLGVRVRERINGNHEGLLTNAEGKTGEGRRPNNDRKGCWGLVSAWCDYSGSISEKEKAGIALFADPTNHVDTAWHVGNYGLMAANPFGREKHARFPDRKGNNTPVKIVKGEHLKLRYGVFVHIGDVKSGQVAEYYARFVKMKKD
jgi:hypothetical protein